MALPLGPGSHHIPSSLCRCHLRPPQWEKGAHGHAVVVGERPIRDNIIKSQAGAGPISAFRSSEGSGFLNERFSITKLGFHPSPLWGAVYLLIHRRRALPGRGWWRHKGWNGFPGTGTVMNTPSLPPRQTEHLILLGAAACQSCLGDES